ncbi:MULTISPECIES: metallophosphoesterase family protein [Flavobacteriaceae]|uniref:metallophosphoesterase family protein n=1 Tax=Flavobacteriaceae TaxID=49546 RepID=UPI0014925D18|nr:MULTISPECIES: metallophosphoesterase [Allomuricauda]MDC6365661.1 metallophosphoesterase [Muricauda sp. AC10]
MDFKRRKLIKGIALTGCGALVSNPMMGQKEGVNKQRVLRIAHITDVHLSADNNAPDRFASCINEIKKREIDFFLNGGDSIMAADYDNIVREQVHEMWTLWKAARQKFAGYKMYSCLGNHDMWWAAPNKKDSMYGKKFAMEQLDMPSTYYSFDQNGWHFVVLDSNNNGGGALGREQLQWFSDDLAKLPKDTPVLVMSHYPILSASTHAVGGNHKDSLPITKLLYKHQDKRIHCISGHVHLLDTAIYNNVHYYCNGSMSGFWWGEGDKDSAQKYWYHETPPGYTILDLYEDGSLQNTYYPHQY